jgi:hypothetical protein
VVEQTARVGKTAVRQGVRIFDERAKEIDGLEQTPSVRWLR